ncbi:metal ABC transporter ATP-binding protein [Cardiobacterium hominis]|uniref:metal ABC transporter ATP-binding protein n=1 Tax=Cardiobacterium hominis TaxID=2718 RepID=UPI0028D77342|nr:ATP-binding cassette domain-containing protein [Cardiobacterium hominis]
MVSSTDAISLAVENVSVTYPNGHQAIRDVTFTLQGRTVCALVGVNGSGKSTLFNTIMGIIRPQSGSVRVNGLPVAQAMRQNGIAYVPQSENIDWHFPILVKDVVMLGRYGHMGMLRRPQAPDREAVAAALERLGIADLAERQIGALSGGQKKRVFLARALAQQSRIILLDEPFTGVDAKTEFAVMELLKNLRDEGYLMLVSTHNLGAVPQYCNEVVLINRELIAHGDIAEIYTVDNLERAFGSVLKNIGLGEVAPQVRIVSDDEHPAVFVDDRSSCP